MVGTLVVDPAITASPLKLTHAALLYTEPKFVSHESFALPRRACMHVSCVEALSQELIPRGVGVRRVGFCSPHAVLF